MIKLNIEKKFTDKYTGVKYKIGDVVLVEEERAKELLADARKLVSKNEEFETATAEPKDVEIPEKPVKKTKKSK